MFALHLFWSLFVGLTLAQAPHPHHQIRWTPGQKVRTSSGILVGKESAWQEGVSEYLGVPFAVPPLAELRFAPPVPFQGGNGTVNATTFSADCPANLRPLSARDNGTQAAGILSTLGQVGDTMSEDCLSLNIWAKPQSGNPGKAVMIWIYGGAFTTGTSASPTYDGARLAAEQDVIVVSMNYRLNIFGFPGAPFLKDNNLGLLDQRLAIEWVRDNIARFGGNPTRITLFGESAGGASVDYYSFAWTADPIVSGFIPESGTASSGIGGSPATGTNWYAASTKLGCGGITEGEATLACVRKKSMEEVLDSIKPDGGAAALGLLGFGPYVDDQIVFGDYAKRRAEGGFIKRPMLVGNNDNEAGLFEILQGGGTSDGVSNSSTPGSAKRSFNLDTIFTCPARIAAKARRDADVPAWRYRYAGEFPNQAIGPRAGAYHGSEIALVFGTTEFKSKIADTPEEMKLGKTMRDAWGTFARDPVNGLTKYGWPLYNESKPTLVKLGGPENGDVTFVDNAIYDKLCNIAPATPPAAPAR